jgi:DNA-binding transcriptional LysR family regulator
MKFTLRQLEVFLATARQENLSRAATNLAMSQSAASDALKELEHQFDVQLFDRIGKRLQLNEAGRLLLPLAEELLSRAAEVDQVLTNQAGLGALKVGATLSIGNHLCIPLIDLYRQRYPNSRVGLEIANTEIISHLVANFELDVGLIEGEINNPALNIQPWRGDELVIVASPQHPLADNDAPLTDAQLLSANWIIRENGSGTRQTFNRVMHDLLPQLNIILEIQHSEAIIQAVRMGMGLGCLSRLSVQDSLDRGEVVALQANDRSFRRNFYLLVHRHKYQSTALQHWLELCKEYT